MPDRQLAHIFLEQSNDLIWIIDSGFYLKYANQAYQKVMKQVTGEEKKIDEPIFTEGFGDGYIEKWKAYYERGLKGERFEIVEHFSNPSTNQIEYSEISFHPILDENQLVVSVACQSRDITSFIKSNTEAEELLDASLDVICSIDQHGTFTKVSAACKELWGFEKHELVGKPYTDFVIEEDIEKTKEVAAIIIDGNAMTTFENRYKRKDGGVAFNFWSAKWDPKNQIIVCVARNGLEKIKKEELLIESENRFKALVQEGSDLIGILDETGIYTYVSPTSVDILGIQPEEFIGNSTFDYIHPEDAEKTRISLSKIASESRVEVEPFRFQNINGEWRWIETVLTNMLSNPAILGIVANSRDITEKIEQENKILHGQKRFEALVENGMDGVIIISPEGNTTYVSKSIKSILGYSPAELMDMDFRELVHPEDLPHAESALLLCISNPGVPMKGYTSRVKHKNGSWRWIEPIITNLLHDPAINGIVDNFRDITEEKHLRELNREVGKLAKIGSWEMDLINQDGDSMYWSPVLREIVEVDDNYNPTLSGGIEFHIGESRVRIQKALDLLIKEGTEFDEEILLLTAKGNERWNRAIGKSEIVNGKRTRIYGSYQDIHERKTSAMALEQSLKSLKDYKYSLDQSAIIAFTDNKGVITSVNDNFCNISKYKREEIIGKTHRLINSNHHPKEFFIDLWKTIASGQVWRGEIKNKTKDGDYYWVDTTIVPFLDRKNKPSQYLAIRFDITERKKAEQEKISLQETIENSLNEIYTFDAETLLFNYVNHGALLNLGYSEKEIKALTPLDLKPEYTKTLFNKLIAPLRNNKKEKITFFTNHKRKDGSLYPVEVHLQLVSDGNTKRFLAVILDITVRRKVEEENRFKANLLSTIGQAAIATDLNGIINYWNKAAEHIYGWKREEAIGKNIMDLVTPEDNILEASEIMEVLKKGQTWLGEFKVKKKDGTSFLAMVSNSPIYNEQNELSGMIGISSDITEKVKNEQLLKQYTRELERSNEELEQFAFITSHDLQEPLRMISSFMDQLKRKYSDSLDEKGLQYIYFATDGAKRMKQIILDLLLYSRANKPDEQNELINLNELVSDYIQLRRKIIAEKSATITFHELPSIETYRAPITQVFHCLLDNALKYVNENKAPYIEIDAIEKENVWQFAIKDNGVGIDHKFFDKIFVIFQRLQNRKENDGTGIGLAVAKRSVEFLGGEIWVESEVDKGSTFYFTLLKMK